MPSAEWSNVEQLSPLSPVAASTLVYSIGALGCFFRLLIPPCLIVFWLCRGHRSALPAIRLVEPEDFAALCSMLFCTRELVESSLRSADITPR